MGYRFCPFFPEEIRSLTTAPAFARSQSPTPLSMTLPQYEDWAVNCSKLLDDLSVLRQWLERHDAPLHTLDIQDKLKKQILIAQTMLPPPDDIGNDDEDVTHDDEDTDAVADLSETYVDLCYPVNTPVRALPPPVNGDQDPIVPEARTTSERDVGTVDLSGSRKSLPRIRIERGKWALPEDKRIIDVPDLKDYRARGLLRDDKGWKEYFEEVKELTEPSGSKTRLACKICIRLGKPGGLHSVANVPSQERQGYKSNSLMSHIQKYHKNILITCVKCGCDGDGKKGHAPEGYRYFHTLQNHIRGIYRRERETHYNIHYRTRRECDEPLERHVGFAIKQVQQL